MTPPNTRKSILEVKKAVAAHYRIEDVSLLAGNDKWGRLVEGRHMAITLCMTLGHPAKEVERAFKRHKTSITYSIRTTYDRIKADKGCREAYDFLVGKLKNVDAPKLKQ